MAYNKIVLFRPTPSMKRNQLLFPHTPLPFLPRTIVALREWVRAPLGVEFLELPCAACRLTTELGDRASVFAVWEAGTGIGVSAARIGSHAGFPADVGLAAFVAAAVGADVDAAHRGGGGGGG
ncbi:hypothetical protein LTR01_002113 [Friedmanniomyces endolithicus]|nr:hypothetical protein LTR01_002113 [Friedmanniomyces endolithicus]